MLGSQVVQAHLHMAGMKSMSRTLVAITSVVLGEDICNSVVKHSLQQLDYNVDIVECRRGKESHVSSPDCAQPRLGEAPTTRQVGGSPGSLAPSVQFRVPVTGCCRDEAGSVDLCLAVLPTTAPAAPAIPSPPLNIRHGATSQRCQPCFQWIAQASFTIHAISLLAAPQLAANKDIQLIVPRALFCYSTL